MSEIYYFICVFTTFQFYKNKTIERVEQFRIKYPDWEEPYLVNGGATHSIDWYLRKIDWSWLCETSEWRFIHGDLHFDNTIYDAVADKFTAIDWRTDFAGSLYGDLYYDLAKLLGGIRLSYKAIKDDQYVYSEMNQIVKLSVPAVENAEIYENQLKQWVESNKLNWNKVEILVPLIYLNMSPLHESPFDKFLVALAQYYFMKIL